MKITYDFHFFIHNINMIYFISIISGVLNGLFAAAAGQVLIFYLVFILKLETHMSRATSIFCMSLITIISVFGYIKFAQFDLHQIIIAIASGLVFGTIGSKLMSKIKSEYLNLVSGLIVFGLGIYKLIVK